jgi:hypothetical protein
MNNLLPSWPGLTRPSTPTAISSVCLAIALFGVVLTEEVLQSIAPLPVHLLGGFSRAEATLYTSPHLPDVPPDYPNVRGTATYYVSGVPAAGSSWMPGTNPGMTIRFV